MAVFCLIHGHRKVSHSIGITDLPLSTPANAHSKSWSVLLSLPPSQDAHCLVLHTARPCIDGGLSGGSGPCRGAAPRPPGGSAGGPPGRCACDLTSSACLLASLAPCLSPACIQTRGPLQACADTPALDTDLTRSACLLASLAPCLSPACIRTGAHFKPVQIPLLFILI